MHSRCCGFSKCSSHKYLTWESEIRGGWVRIQAENSTCWIAESHHREPMWIRNTIYKGPQHTQAETSSQGTQQAPRIHSKPCFNACFIGFLNSGKITGRGRRLLSQDGIPRSTAWDIIRVQAVYVAINPKKFWERRQEREGQQQSFYQLNPTVGNWSLIPTQSSGNWLRTCSSQLPAGGIAGCEPPAPSVTGWELLRLGVRSLLLAWWSAACTGRAGSACRTRSQAHSPRRWTSGSLRKYGQKPTASAATAKPTHTCIQKTLIIPIVPNSEG